MAGGTLPTPFGVAQAALRKSILLRTFALNDLADSPAHYFARAPAFVSSLPFANKS